MVKKLKKGKTGNAAQYITRTQAVRKLQLRLSEFRRLCILKGIHPREPRKKPKGAHKTYYHLKDINWLAHEPLLATFRNIKVHDRKVRRARAKKNADLARRLAEDAPRYQLDHLVKERYPSFVDALRDLDDALTMVNLFATLPAEKKYDIPVKAVHTARRLALEWQAYIARSASLRRVFVSVKGYYFQADVAGQSVTWLVPHALSQVLPPDVDYRVMLTFLEFHNTLLQFVNFKLYHTLGVRYPPVLDERLVEAAEELAAILADLAGVRDAAEGDRAAEAATVVAADAEAAAGGGEADATMRARIDSLQDRLREIVGAGDEGAEEEGAKEEEVEEDSEAGDEDDDEPPVLDSGGGDDDEEDDEEEEEQQGGAALDAAARSGGRASTSKAMLLDDEEEEDEDDSLAVRDGAAGGADQDAGTRAAGGALGPGVDPSDEAALCRTLFRGRVFFLGREVPREPLLLVIRAFGGVAAWAGEGSPHEEADEAITHQVVDRPTQGHKFLSREYVQPQWVFDSANFRVLMDASLYAPGGPPPPHLSPFVGEEGDDGYTPDFAKTIKRLQDAARAARMRAAGLVLKGADGSEFVGEEAEAGDGAADGDAAGEAGDDVAVAERVYKAELAKELRQAKRKREESGEKEGSEEGGSEESEEEGGSEEEEEEEDEEEEGEKPAKKGRKGPEPKRKAAEVDEEAAMADIMMPRKAKKMYNNMIAKDAAKKERAETLEAKKAQLAATGAAGPMGQAKSPAAAGGAGSKRAAPEPAAAAGKGKEASGAAKGGKEAAAAGKGAKVEAPAAKGGKEAAPAAKGKEAATGAKGKAPEAKAAGKVEGAAAAKGGKEEPAKAGKAAAKGPAAKEEAKGAAAKGKDAAAATAKGKDAVGAAKAKESAAATAAAKAKDSKPAPAVAKGKEAAARAPAPAAAAKGRKEAPAADAKGGSKGAKASAAKPEAAKRQKR